MQQLSLCVIKVLQSPNSSFEKNTNALRNLWVTLKAFIYCVCDSQFFHVHHILAFNITEFPSASLTVGNGRTFA